jgi:transposase
MSCAPVGVGIDVATAPVDVARRPSAAGWAVPNTAVGSAALVPRLPAFQPPLMGLEATGGLEGPVTAALAAAGRPVVVVNPRQGRDFAKATGRLATPAALEAHGLAHVAPAVRPALRPRPEAPPQARSARRARRRQRLDMRPAEPNRLSSAPPPSRAASQAHSTWRERRVRDLKRALDPALRTSPVGREHATLLQRTPGGGPVRSRTLLADRPDLGPLTRQPLAARGGVAPRTRDSGTRRGKRPGWGGRAQGRAVLSMRTLVAGRWHPGLNTC